MTQWQTMETFPYPEKEWDIDCPQFLFYSVKCGVVIGVCYLTDADETDFHAKYAFRFDKDGFTIYPTHWMPLPTKP